MRIVCISDTHGRHEELDLPDGDVLVHAGDFDCDPWDFADWLEGLPYRDKIFIGGNHDHCYEPCVPLKVDNTWYLKDSSASIRGVKFYGSPWTSWDEWPDMWAFGEFDEKLLPIFAEIPVDTDILVTHTPPYGLLDFCPENQKHFGSTALRLHIQHVRPKVHVFGHIHAASGQTEVAGTTFINAACSIQVIDI